ncbi:MAG: hypothetical protein R2697_11810 [Ilumatobacteraceae bacterium]
MVDARHPTGRPGAPRCPTCPIRPPATWFTYVRCHDDIGWAIDDADALAVGVTGAGHRSFLTEFFRGDFPDSFALGTPFGVNEAVGDERTSGMASALAGVTAAIRNEDAAALARAIDRIGLLYGIAFGRRHPDRLHGRRAVPARRPDGSTTPIGAATADGRTDRDSTRHSLRSGPIRRR